MTTRSSLVWSAWFRVPADVWPKIYLDRRQDTYGIKAKREKAGWNTAIPGLTIIVGISEQNFRNDRILIRRRFCKFCSDAGKNQSG